MVKKKRNAQLFGVHKKLHKNLLQKAAIWRLLPDIGKACDNELCLHSAEVPIPGRQDGLYYVFVER